MKLLQFVERPSQTATRILSEYLLRQLLSNLTFGPQPWPISHPARMRPF